MDTSIVSPTTELASSRQPIASPLQQEVAGTEMVVESEQPSLSSVISSSLQAIHGAAETQSPSSSRADAYEYQDYVDDVDTAKEYEGSEKELSITHHHLLTSTPINSVSSNLSSEDSAVTHHPPPPPDNVPTHYDIIQNTNNCNSCEVCPLLTTPSDPQTSFVPPHHSTSISLPLSDPTSCIPPHHSSPSSTSPNSLPLLSEATCEPPRKKYRAVKHGSVDVTLEGKALWDEFCRRGTEMIVNRTGRRMFPGFSVAVSGLKPKAKYSMKVEMVLADNHRFKFLNARWLAVGTAEPQPLTQTYVHPDSPNSGAFWMRHGVSFRKLKITNNKDRPGTNALLYSMHKYFLRLIVDEERKMAAGEERQPARTVLNVDFPETTFVAVTAYQNEEVTQLKISNNPFAKAFRENAADMDWETAQMLYGNQATFPHHHPAAGGIYSPHMDHFNASSSLTPGGAWPSPLLLPTPLSGSLPPISPLTTLTPHSYTAPYLTPSGHYPYTSSSSGAVAGGTNSHYFQWPQVLQRTSSGSQHADMYDHYYSHIKPLHPPSLPHHPHTITSYPPPSHPHHTLLPQPQISVANSNLPDFDSVFTCTPSLGHSSHDVMS